MKKARDFSLTCVLVATVCVPASAQYPPDIITSPSPLPLRFGTAIAANERHLLIGDGNDSALCGGSLCYNGWAFAYERTPDGAFVPIQDVLPGGLAEGWIYGWEVAIDGDRALVSAAGVSTGMVYVFEHDGERWVQVGTLPPPDGRAIHGGRLAIHGDTALIGKAGEDILVYKRGITGWEVTHDLSSPDSPSVRADFGWSIDLNDDWIVIGSPGERTVVGFGGAVYVYRRLPGGELELAQKLTAPDILMGPRFGISIVLDGDRLAVGAPESDRTFDAQGAVHLYALRDGRWEYDTEVLSPEPAFRSRFGSVVEMQGGVLAAASAGLVLPTGFGIAEVFRDRGDGRWAFAARLEPTEPTGSSSFGEALEVAQGTLFVGAQTTIVGGETQGAVYAYDLSCFACRPDLDADGALTIFDFLLFFNLFDDGDTQADFDGDGELTIFDFVAFQTAFDAGCA